MPNFLKIDPPSLGSLRIAQVPISRSTINIEAGQVWQARDIFPRAWVLDTPDSRMMQPWEKFLIHQGPNDQDWYTVQDQVQITLLDGQRTTLPRWALENNELFRRLE